MDNPVRAIYENGVLRPLHPLGLEEHEVVWLVVQRSTSKDDVVSEASTSRTALEKLLTATAALPAEGPSDVFSNREHDRVLYGDKE